MKLRATSKRPALVICAVGLLLCFLATFIPTTPPTALATTTPYIHVTPAGFANDPSGATMAQFSIENVSPRHLRFAVGQVQVHQPGGWTNWLVSTGRYRPLPPGAKHVISIPVPTVSTPEGAVWRVPIMSEPDPPLMDQLRDRIDAFAFRVAHWRLRRAARTTGAAIAFSPEVPALMDSQTNYVSSETARTKSSAP
jgi:hypothetical protein